MSTLMKPPMPATIHPQDTDTKVFLRDETDRLLKRLQALIVGGGRSEFIVSNYWQGELRWARNRASMTSDRRDTTVNVVRTLRGGNAGVAMTNQLDEASLIGAIRSAERRSLKSANRAMQDMALDLPSLSAMQTTTWSDATLSRTAADRAALVRAVTDEAERQQLLSAGYVESRGVAIGSLSIDEYGRSTPFYGQLTQAQCSATVRHPQGTSSGWAGISGYDITRIDEHAIAKRALDKCLASLNPVRIEPGRYTVILEPQAVADLMEMLIGSFLRYSPENVHPATPPKMAGTPYFLRYDAGVARDRSMLGMRIIDDRITVSHDPSDPLLGVLPVTDVKPAVWIQNGVLQTLSYTREWALNELNDNEGASFRSAYRMSGGTTTMDEMIATTKRGLIVTRLSSVRMVDRGSLLSTGVTRDGLWLVENGKITKAVRNFRFTESPLFVLNNVVDLGEPVPIFRPTKDPKYAGFGPVNALTPAIVPCLKANDFSFTSTIDAV